MVRGGSRAKKKEQADARRALGRSRGGLSTKIHAAVDAAGQPVRLLLTGGQRDDRPQAAALLQDFTRGEIGCVVADAGYDSDAIRRRVRRLQAKCCIKPTSRRKVKKRYDRQIYRMRNLVERFFGRVKRYRRVATRYDKKAANYLGFLWIAAVFTQLK